IEIEGHPFDFHAGRGEITRDKKVDSLADAGLLKRFRARNGSKRLFEKLVDALAGAHLSIIDVFAAAAYFLAAFNSSASNAISSRAGSERIWSTPLPAQSERKSALPFFTLVFRMSRVKEFCAGNGKIAPESAISFTMRFSSPRAHRPENARVSAVVFSL